MSKKTMGDYLRMMIDTEHTPDEKGTEKETDTNEEVIESRPVIKGRSIQQRENDNFMRFVSDKISTLGAVIDNGVNKLIEKDGEFSLIEYIILGVTLEQGLIVVLKCFDQFDNNVNFHIEINDDGVSYKGEV